MELLWSYRTLLLQGAWVTVQVTVLAALVALPLAILGGAALRARSRWLRWPARLYTEIFRGTSALAQLFWLFFVLPNLGLRIDPLPCAVLGLGLCYGAYGAAVVRGALDAVPRRQIEAAIALNFSDFRTFRSVILPQAVVLMIPLFGNIGIELLKTSSLVSLITLSDLTFQARSIMRQSLHSIEVLTLLMAGYFLLSRVIGFGANRLEAAVAGHWHDRERR